MGAIGEDYLSVQELKSYMGLETDQTDALVGSAISSASREIERFTNRQFNRAEVASARLYVARQCDMIAVDDFWTTDDFKLEVDQSGTNDWTEVDASEYQLAPLNKMLNGIEWVYWRIELIGSTRLPVLGRRAAVRVTAKWGWEAVPSDVLQAVKIHASDTYQLKDSRMGIAGSDQFGTILRVRDNSAVGAKLKHFCRDRVKVA